MDEWANSLKELEMLLPPTSGGSVTGVCFITKNVQIVCGENTAEYTRYIFTIYTASLVLQTKAIRRFVITEKAPPSLNVKLGQLRNYHKGQAVWLA